MRTTAKLTTVIVLAGLIGMAQVAVAQEDETGGAGSAHVTGTLLDLTHDTYTQTSDWKGDVLEWRDWVSIFQYEWSDPRMPTEIRSYNTATSTSCKADLPPSVEATFGERRSGTVLTDRGRDPSPGSTRTTSTTSATGWC